MDFEKILTALTQEFKKRDIRYALIGGVALGFLGKPRATQDIDFIVHRDDLPSLDAAMGAHGFKKLFSSENASQYQHKDVSWSRVDFLHAYRTASLNMLSRAILVNLSETETVFVAKPEDIIGLKVQGMANDPSRENQDKADIEALISAQGEKMDWKVLEEYFKLFNREPLLKELKKKFHA